MIPSPFRIPQRCPRDRQIAREATIRANRARYELTPDAMGGDPAEGFRLPPYLKALPKQETFVTQKLAELMGHKLQGELNAKLVFGGFGAIEDYRRLFRVVPEPTTARAWNDDVAFARQRVAGVNPMHLRARDEAPPAEMADAVGKVLAHHHTTLAHVMDRGRLFETDYAVLADPRIQKWTNGRHLATPRCLFFVGDDDVLRPIAIGNPGSPTYTPLDDPWAWQLAKWHAQCADATIHEGVYHLLETHLVTEVIAVCAARNLHPDHPLTSLLTPHFANNLAIDDLARKDMLAPGQAIDLALSPGSAGALNAIRLWFNAGWSWEARSLEPELLARGMADRERLPDYPFRDHARPLHHVLTDYVDGIVRAFYRTDAEVAGDPEARAWATECASHLPGFPVPATREALVAACTEVIFRASVLHAAVNNGQYDAYGFVPNAPGSMLAPFPTKASYTEAEALAALPKGKAVFAQVEMSWVLSEPTHYGLLGIGAAPAFAAEVSPEAREVVATARRRIYALQTPKPSYLYLDPRNIEVSTGT
ncbi:MAG: lipoxygenase family protein [Myxococcota bacterium]